MQALSAIGKDSATAAVPKLIEVLGQPDVDSKVLVEACTTLGRYGVQAASAVPALRRLLGHDEGDVRAAASDAILAVNVATTKATK
jgi:HEAT repeat protein